ncbi:alpha carbonic anhydrase 7 [Daucus carota subsp. sativus]|uniref:alpha carbonic anhydrase 7 n=1 Tax=Daucus carota subsp. sativus TaxID=79200 RepID=UPI0007EFE9C6|nr:PREDICTED: alpha carbonic anhydrase 7-like [Daucus carota subsp. sativus]
MKSILVVLGHIMLIVSLHAATNEAQEFIKPYPRGYNASGHGEYDYDEDSGRGPSEWGNLKPEWALCKKGKMQSPVDLTNVTVKLVSDSDVVYAEYQPSFTTLLNRGHDVALEWKGDAGSIEINGVEYRLQQVHWHAPSEHTIRGKRYELERHAVHVNSDTNEIAVISVLYKIGRNDPFLFKLRRYLKTMVETNVNETFPGIINPSDTTCHDDESFYRYTGSLTTPPCSEGVIWTVQRKIRTVSRRQVDLLLNVVHGNENARPLQAVNKREMFLYVSCKGTGWDLILNPLQYIQRKLFYSSG